MTKTNMKKIIILITAVAVVITAVAVVLSADFATGQVINTSIQMKLVRVLGERSVITFKNATGTVMEFSTAADYNRRFIDIPKGGKQDPPVKEGYQFQSAVRATWFDTFDGFIHPGQYATSTENGEARVFLMTSSTGRYYNFSRAELLEFQSIKL